VLGRQIKSKLAQNLVAEKLDGHIIKIKLERFLDGRLGLIERRTESRNFDVERLSNPLFALPIKRHLNRLYGLNSTPFLAERVS
jgi:hypothetical protein